MVNVEKFESLSMWLFRRSNYISMLLGTLGEKFGRSITNWFDSRFRSEFNFEWGGGGGGFNGHTPLLDP
jgi:hypothetical protein